MDGINDYLKKKAKELDLGRADVLRQAQNQLDDMFPGKCRVVSLQNGILRVTTRSASVASELRFRRRELLGAGNLKQYIKKLAINIT